MQQILKIAPIFIHAIQILRMFLLYLAVSVVRLGVHLGEGSSENKSEPAFHPRDSNITIANVFLS